MGIYLKGRGRIALSLGKQNYHMKNFKLILISLTICLISCAKKTNKNQKDYLERKLISTIIEKSTDLQFETAILDSRPYTFEQIYKGDTLFIQLNNFTILYDTPPYETIIFEALRDSVDLTSQGVLEISDSFDAVPVISLDSTNFVTVSNKINVPLFQFAWSKLNYKNLVAFTKPIVNKYGIGVIGQIIYKNGELKQMVYKFSTSNTTSVQLIQCLSFKPLGYFLEFEKDRLKNIYNGQTVYNGFCN